MKSYNIFFSAILIIVKMNECHAQVPVKKTTDEINEKAELILQNCIDSRDPSTIFEKTVILCPNIWKEVSNMLSGEELENNSFDVNFHKNNIVLYGKAVQSLNVFKQIWLLMINEPQFKVRKPTEHEILVYWQVISHNIEEPLFVLYTKRKKYIVEMDYQNFTVLFIEKL